MSAKPPPASVRPVPPGVLELPVAGRNLRAATLGAELGPETTLLVFLRHLG